MDEKLKPHLSPLGAAALAFGCAVGWGCFSMPGSTFQEDIQAAPSAGMDGHIAKPLDIAVITDTLARILNEKEHQRR